MSSPSATTARQIAVPVRVEDGSFTDCVNGEAWPETFELLWYLRFTPWGQLIALVRIDDEWTVALDGAPWENRFEYAWNPGSAPKGSPSVVLYKQDNKFGVSINDQAVGGRLRFHPRLLLEPGRQTGGGDGPDGSLEGSRYLRLLRRRLVGGGQRQTLGQKVHQCLESRVQSMTAVPWPPKSEPTSASIRWRSMRAPGPKHTDASGLRSSAPVPQGCRSGS